MKEICSSHLITCTKTDSWKRISGAVTCLPFGKETSNPLGLRAKINQMENKCSVHDCWGRSEQEKWLALLCINAQNRCSRIKGACNMLMMEPIMRLNGKKLEELLHSESYEPGLSKTLNLKHKIAKDCVWTCSCGHIYIENWAFFKNWNCCEWEVDKICPWKKFEVVT